MAMKPAGKAGIKYQIKGDKSRLERDEKEKGIYSYNF